MGSTPSLGEGELEDRPDNRDWRREREGEEQHDLPSSPRVTINPSHPPWDDNSLPDQPYENPYYTLPIKDALWLPINPIGTLDLDMTVTMSVALTSEPGAGHLGPFSERLTSVGSVLSGLTADLESGISTSGDEISIHEPSLDGTEEKELTTITVSRVQNPGDDGDPPTTDQQPDSPRATRLRPKTSGGAISQNTSPDPLTGAVTQLPLTSSPPSSPAAPPTPRGEVFPMPPSLLTGSLRSLSSGALLKTPGSPERGSYPRRASFDAGGRLAVRRPRPSLNQMRSTNSISQNSFLSPPSTGAGSRFAQLSVISHASAQSVVIQEALNEETEVLQRSHIQQQQEAEKQNIPRSKWTSWAFKKHK